MKYLQLLFGSQPQQPVFKSLWGSPTEWSCIEDSALNFKSTEIYTHVSKKPLANNKSPLDAIIDSQNAGNRPIKTKKNNSYKKK